MKIRNIQTQIKNAKEEKISSRSLKNQLASLKSEQKKINAQIKGASKKNILFNRANKPLLDAQKCIARYESYRDFKKFINI